MNDEQKRLSAIEKGFVKALCELMKRERCSPDQAERCVGMIAALSCCVGSLVGAMDAYGAMVGSSSAASEHLRSDLVKLVTARIAKSGNLASEIASSVWEARR